MSNEERVVRFLESLAKDEELDQEITGQAKFLLSEIRTELSFEKMPKDERTSLKKYMDELERLLR